MARPTKRLPRRGGLTLVPSIVTLALWQLRQTWRLLLVVGVGIIAAVVLVCAVPLYSQVAMSAGLRDALNSSAGDSYVSMQSVAPLISGAAIQRVEQQLNREIYNNLGEFIDTPPQFSILSQGLHVNRFDQVQLVGAPIQQASTHVKLLQGQLPQTNSGAMELAITPEAAAYLHVQVGSVLAAQVRFNNSEGSGAQVALPLHIVGIFRPTSQDDAFWHGETFDGRSLGVVGTLYPALVSNQAFISVFDQISSNLVKQPGMANQAFEEPTDIFWYYSFDSAHVDINRLDDLANGLDTVLADVSNKPVVPGYVEKTLASGPNDLLDGYSNRIDVVRIPVLSLAYLIVGLVLFFVSLMTDLLVDRQSDAIAMLRSRGASRRQIFGSLVIQSIGIGLIALVIGPLLAILAARLLAQSTLSPADQQALNLITGDPLQTATGLYLSALAAVGIAVLAMIVAIYRATRLDVLALRREAARTTNRPLWLRMGVDILAAVIALTGYGFSVYITSPGVLDDRTRVLILPPMTLVGATFLLLGCTLLFLRIFPFVLRFLAELAARSRSATPVLALAQMARAPRQSLRMTLLLALAVAFAIFTLSFTTTQAQRVPDVVAYQVGADFSGTFPSSTQPATTKSLAQQQAAYSHIPGVTSVTLGYESSSRASESGLDVSMELRAVDSSTFARTAIWTAQDSSQPLDSLMQQLSGTQNGGLPAIVDAAAWNTLHLSIGSPFTLTDLHGTVNFIAVAEVNYIPTVNDSAEASGTGDYVPFGGVLVDYQKYADALELNNAAIAPSNVWLRTRGDNASLASVRSALGSGKLALDGLNDRRAIIQSLLNDPLYLALVGVLFIGSLTALLLGLVGNLTVSWLSARTRLTNFAVMRALGSTPPQIAGVLTWEQGIVYATAIGLGIAFGLLLSVLVLPAFVFTAVAGSESASQFSTGQFYVVQNVPPVQMIIPIVLIGIALGILVAICIIAVGMMIVVVSQPSISSTLRLSED